MISPREATLALAGAVRLAKFDAKGTLFFNATVNGFWNSFWVAALILPFHLLHSALLWQSQDIPTTALRYFSLEIIMYGMGWVALPLAMVYVCRAMDWSDRFLKYGVANNWSDLIVSAITLPVQIAIVTGLLTGAAMSMVLAVIIVYSIGVAWFVARHALNISGLAAMGVVSMAVFINLFIHFWGAVLLTSTA